MNIYERITEGLSGASRAYRKTWKRHDRYRNKITNFHDSGLKQEYTNKANKELPRISKLRKVIPRSPKREADRAEHYWNKFGAKHGVL